MQLTDLHEDKKKNHTNCIGYTGNISLCYMTALAVALFISFCIFLHGMETGEARDVKHSEA